VLQEDLLVMFVAIVEVIEDIDEVVLGDIALIFKGEKVNYFNDVLASHKKFTNFLKNLDQLFNLPARTPLGCRPL
jgi:hypothetical protein